MSWGSVACQQSSDAVDMQVLDALAMVGLRDSLTIDVLLDAAKALEDESAADESACNRATALLQQLDIVASGTLLAMICYPMRNCNQKAMTILSKAALNMGNVSWA